MADWNEVLNELESQGSTHDVIRRKYLLELSELTGRNVIAYYSGWLQKNIPELGVGLRISDNDKNGFMTATHGLDSTKGLDLILHTPGGDVAATESIIDYLTTKFDDIRVIVPQLAMSGGTMIACAGNRILMGKQSSLGPIDPQFNGIPAHGILEEFQQAHEEIKADKTKAYVWQPIIGKYNPTLIGECRKAVDWSAHLAEKSLGERMLQGDPKKDEKIEKILEELVDHSVSLSHARHLSAAKCQEMGLVVDMLEDDQSLQDAVLTVHHTFTHTLAATPAYKIIENHLGKAFIQTSKTIIVPK